MEQVANNPEFPGVPSLLNYRRLGRSKLGVSPVAMGCWPITGMTSLDVNESDSLATLVAAAHAGINFFDSAYCYGLHGESEQLIAKALGAQRDQLILATKGGIEWSSDRKQRIDGTASALERHCNESLKRLQTDRVDLYYLHAPDPECPIEESAAAIGNLIQQGKIRFAGASNCTLAQYQRFHAICPLTAIQPHYNMLQREIEMDILPWARAEEISVVVYWPLLKGLLAGKMNRDFVFRPGDGRAKYPMFQGEEWEKNQDFLDRLRALAKDMNRSLAEVVIRWTIEQPGITNAICGAKRPYQIVDSAQAMTFDLTAEERNIIDQALEARGTPVSKPAV